MKKQAVLRYFLGYIIVTITGCGYYRPTTMLRPPHEGLKQEIESVSICLKPLRDFECAHYFDHRLVSRARVQPLQVYIQNNSDKYYVLQGSHISVPILGKRSVGAILYKNIFGRSLVWGFGTAAIFWQLFLPLWVIDMIFSLQANKNIRNDIESICINPKERVVITPNSRVHKVLFVLQEDYHHHIDITLVEQQTDNELVFKF